LQYNPAIKILTTDAGNCMGEGNILYLPAARVMPGISITNGRLTGEKHTNVNTVYRHRSPQK
jgi:hypothetical protein